MEKLRLWLIRKVVGKIPVCMNMKISPPKDKNLEKGIVYLGNSGTVGIINRCFVCYTPNAYILRPIDFDKETEI